MRRPSEKELRGDPWFGALFGVVLDLAAAMGMSIDDLPDIIPEDPANSEELQRHMKAVMESRGLTEALDGHPEASTKGMLMDQEKITEESLGDVAEEFKKTDDAGRAAPGAVLAGDAEAEPIVESHKDK